MFSLNVILIPQMLLILAKEIYMNAGLLLKIQYCKHGKFIHTYFIVSGRGRGEGEGAFSIWIYKMKME